MSFFRRRKQDPDDNDLTLRPVRSAVETLAEANRLEERAARRRKAKVKRSRSRFFSKSSVAEDLQAAPVVPTLEVTPPPAPVSAEPAAATPAAVTGPRRRVYLNQPLPASELDQRGDPSARYPRNKVRTTKYTPLTFIPKNLYEQFSRVANIYFVLTVVLTISPIFAGPNAILSVIPIGVILTTTAIKDAIEDLRRAASDEEVNVAAANKLGGSWRNVNQPRDPRSFIERLLGLNKPGQTSRGVRKLREKEKDQPFVPLARPGSALEDTFGRSAAMSVETAMCVPMPNESSSPLVLHRTETDRTSVRSAPPSGARWERTLWKKLVVGDLVLLRDDDQVPADMLVLATSDSDGLCFIETKNLDGETNLKPRRAVRATHALASEDDWASFRAAFDTDAPHSNLYVQNGLFTFGGGQVEATSINEFLLRGCAVRNTAWVVGLVVFTGADSKIMLNGGDTPTKRSRIEKETYFNVVMSFILVIAMCLFVAIANGIALGRPMSSEHFFYEDEARETKSTTLSAILNFGAAIIVFQNIVPIGLYISLEIVRTLQAYLISQDLDMWYEPLKTACVPKSWNISDDLGQIEYIFSDKTGTLTQNIMEFQRCSINGVAYGEGVTEAQRGQSKQRVEQGGDFDPEVLQAAKDKMLDVMQANWPNPYLQKDKLSFVAPRLASELAEETHPQRPYIIAFFRALALCHAVLVERIENPDDDNSTINGHGAPDAPVILEYKSESPDEVALVGAARDTGFPVLSRTTKAIDIEVLGAPERHFPLRVLEFSSARKRMSVLSRAPDGRIVLTCKGADSVIYARLAADHDPELREATQRDMELFANSGLRTLCVAERVLSEEDYVRWVAKYDAAVNSSAPQEERERLIEEAADEVERELTILGATALEDKLQEGVPETIETLHKAGIKLWILTGDKVQTAIEIGFSCNLLRNDMDVMVLSATNADEARTLIESSLEKILPGASAPEEKRGSLKFRRSKSSLTTLSEATSQQRVPTGKFAVVVDGDTLRYALEPSLKSMFLRLTTRCETVVCCRVSPSQKAAVVRLVKQGCNAMTLSIGDGANDVAMIQEANVGCGLFGLEGSQAAMSADYAFGQFRYLTKLLLVHGRWSYLRIADMHGNFFYKNIVWVLPMFWFLFSNGFDAANMYQYTFLLWYNLIFTSAPVIILGATDQDVNAKASLAFPQLYKRGIAGLEYTRTVFWIYMIDGLYQSLVIYFLPFACWNNYIPLMANGHSLDSVSELGTTIAVSAVFAANFYVGLNTRYWSVVTWVSLILSDVSILAWVSGYSFALTVDFYQEMFQLFATVNFWGNVVLSVVLALAPRFFIKFFQQAYHPLDRDLVREMWVKGDLKDQLGLPRRRRGALQRRMSESVSSPTDSSGFRSPPAAEHHEMRPLSFHVTAPSLGGQSDFSPVEREHPPELPRPPSNPKVSRTPTALSYYSVSDIRDS
ncbi:phospholipid-translocating P-type ATPase [Auricularia subglabra TFB-10046 SS5]|nr:phospholipid-translocating P-type ATPase [Auricularia subglabra TFB-10046 SS5]